MKSAAVVQAVVEALNNVIVGKPEQVKLASAALLADGHLLIEDLPGTGKTTLAHALARAFSLQFKRVQFTSDLLPYDVLGGPTLDPEGRKVVLQKGPVFSQVLLADELNRASPKTQSALLEAMEERQVSLNGETLALPKPFFVIATQNPLDTAGTYALPESQLDRFIMRLALGYPSAQAEREILLGYGRRDEKMASLATEDDLAALQQQVSRVRMPDSVVDYIQRLLAASRQPEMARIGLSPRAGQALVRSAKAYALLEGRDFILPDDVQAVFVAVAGHRIQPSGSHSGQETAWQILQYVDVVQ
ncbi:AAA family ATPase [Salinibius halmophilus]|uniref:AAA family ATPase n=1 Tax=Salinibius halmophilus TaxID=1853216 RepID=UPI000E667E29|nr:MoxR family ATPase [Salinibius halmophilus]